jgi:long-chain fatty acid transport protein
MFSFFVYMLYLFMLINERSEKMGSMEEFKMTQNIIFIFICIIIISFSFACRTFANGVLLDAKGPITLGRGGTNIAHADNGILIHDNPAALANLQGKIIEGPLDILTIPTYYQDTDNDKKGESQVFLLPAIAYTQNFDEHRFGIGLGVYNPAGFSAEYLLEHPVYEDQKYFSNASLTKILVGAGYKVTDRLSFGIGLGSSFSKMELEMPYAFQTGLLKGTPALINLEGDDWSFAWNFGAQWEVSSSTTLGLSYIAQDQFNIKGDIDVDVTGLLPLTDTTAHYKASFDFRWPKILGAGIRHSLKSGNNLSLDILWLDWSSAFNELTFDLSEGNNAEFNAMLGGDSTEDTFPLRWKDSYTFRLGYDHSLESKGILRFGYIYNKNPVPETTLTPLIPGILEHSVTVGYGRNWKNWAFNAGYYYAFKNKQSVDTSDIFGGDYDQSTVKLSAHFLSLGFQYKF